MQLIISQDTQSDFSSSGTSLFLETAQYKSLWQKYGDKLIAAFKEITGLDFQQEVITASVGKYRRSEGSEYGHLINLAGDSRSENDKLVTLVHELSHGLLVGNALNIWALGLWSIRQKSMTPTITDEQNEMDHRHIYLFEHDVMKLLGEEYGEMCLNHERYPLGREENYYNLDEHRLGYIRAWDWAMSMSFEQRQNVLRWLTAKRTSRENWKDNWERDPLIPLDVWKKELDDQRDQ